MKLCFIRFHNNLFLKNFRISRNHWNSQEVMEAPASAFIDNKKSLRSRMMRWRRRRRMCWWWWWRRARVGGGGGGGWGGGEEDCYCLVLTVGELIGIAGSVICSETLMELIFNPYSELRSSPEDPVNQIHSPYLHACVPGIFSDILRSVHMRKREWGAENNRNVPHLLIPSKTATLVPEFAVEDLPLMPECAVKDLPLGRTLWWWSYV